MSDEITSSPENSPDPASESAPRVRRISNPRPKKSTKAAAPEETPTPLVVETSSIPFPSGRKREEESSEASSPSDNDWPESEDESSGEVPSQSESAKRKRRRRKGKGQSNGPQNGGESPNDELHSAAAPEAKTTETPQDHRPRQGSGSQAQQPHRPKIDPELLTKMAWKIYLAEVSEEGVALIGDNDAKDLSRRCFRLAEIFIEEQSRRR